MGIAELLLLAVGLSMDAFAVAVCKGLSMPRSRPAQAALIALFFGGFQALMPAAGYVIGSQFERWIASVDHWIAFALLFYIGGKMLYEAFRGGEEEKAADRLALRELLLLAVATSIDALAVGITFALLHVAVIPSSLLIGAVTFAISFAGVYIGRRFGSRWCKGAEIAGGAVLLVIGLKILLEGVGVL